ncbi:MAG: VPLPA-CTERM sorting domain-containing protein [Pseudomonadota bacterium]
MSNTFRTLVAGLAAAATTTAGANAAVFLEQGLNTYELSAFQFDGSAAQAYSFGSPVDFSYNGDTVHGLPTAEDGVAKLFLVNTTDDGLTLFGVFDSVSDGSEGSQDSEWFYIEGDSDGALLVRDDNDGNDVYNETTHGYHLDHQWNACCTDGFVFSLNFDMFDLLGDLSEGGTGLDTLVFVTPDEEIELSFHDAFRIYGEAGEVPLPAALPLGAVGFASLMGVARRRRRKA